MYWTNLVQTQKGLKQEYLSKTKSALDHQDQIYLAVDDQINVYSRNGELVEENIGRGNMLAFGNQFK